MPAEIHQPDPQPIVKDGPLATGEVVPTIIMFCIAALGGLINWWGKVKAGDARPFNFLELMGELLVSGCVGVFTYWGLTGFGINPFLVAAGVGISGHMGTRAIFLAEKVLERRVFGKKG